MLHKKIAYISPFKFGSYPIRKIPKKEININNHCLLLTFSLRKIELARIAKGIASCAPIIIGATKVAFPKDKFKKNITPKPIDKEKPIKGRKYILSIILNLQNGRRQIKSINILKDPASIGGKDVFKASLLIGYELPKTNIINKTKR